LVHSEAPGFSEIADIVGKYLQGSGELIGSQLYQTSAYNPLLLAATIVILALAALLACLFQARRATLVDPVQALRAD
jgi:ABC-type lipoprotein release transport system permease subunit